MLRGAGCSGRLSDHMVPGPASALAPLTWQDLRCGSPRFSFSRSCCCPPAHAQDKQCDALRSRQPPPLPLGSTATAVSAATAHIISLCCEASRACANEQVGSGQAQDTAGGAHCEAAASLGQHGETWEQLLVQEQVDKAAPRPSFLARLTLRLACASSAPPFRHRATSFISQPFRHCNYSGGAIRTRNQS
jgi:hypothetical protein